MDRGFRRGFTAAEKTELWDRWQRGESLKAIGRAFGKPSSSIYFQVIATWRDSSCAAAPLTVGIDAVGTRGDIQGHRDAPIGPIAGQVAGSFAVDGEPRNQPQRRL